MTGGKCTVNGYAAHAVLDSSIRWNGGDREWGMGVSFGGITTHRLPVKKGDENPRSGKGDCAPSASNPQGLQNRAANRTGFIGGGYVAIPFYIIHKPPLWWVFLYYGVGFI